MKRFMSGFLLGAMLFGVVGAVAVSYVANPVDFKVLVNGKEFVSDPPALEVEGRTYLPLRAMGEALGVPVNWNEELRQAEVGLPSITDASTLPAYWIGKWICVRSEYEGFLKAGDEIEFYDYKNKVVLYNKVIIYGGAEHINKSYHLARLEGGKNLLLYYNENLESDPFYELEVVKQTENQIILNRIGFGDEIVLEKKQ
ncbi:MAG: hypothetical protein BWY15_01795 [Firmicutes bacterium ADurb.Bin193]|nr:MAG: hypothetical protein BWY15_01795 [Firmicutes bacterium ADurb.Bin193]